MLYRNKGAIRAQRSRRSCSLQARFAIGDYLGANVASVTVKHADDCGLALVVLCAVTLGAFAVHILALAADERLIHFNFLPVAADLRRY